MIITSTSSNLDIKTEKQSFASILFNKYGIVLAFVVVCIIMAISNPVFLSSRNIFNVIRQISLIGVVATGMTFVILSADIDLSVGSVAALAGVIAAGLHAQSGYPVILAILISLAVSAAIGLIMGLVITKAKVHSFVVSLGMLSVARGLALVYTKGYPIGGLSNEYRFLGGGTIWFIPMPVVIFALALLAAYFILKKTPYGRYVYSIGGNQEATRLSGVNVDFYRIVNFGICSFGAGLAGIILTARVASGQPTASEGWELDAIAAVIIGGTSLSGGRGGIIGTLIGVLFLGVLRNGLNLMQVSPFYQKIFIGLLIVLAVIIDSVKKDD